METRWTADPRAFRGDGSNHGWGPTFVQVLFGDTGPDMALKQQLAGPKTTQITKFSPAFVPAPILVESRMAAGASVSPNCGRGVKPNCQC